MLVVHLDQNLLNINLIGTRAVAGNNITNAEAQAAIAGNIAAGRVVNNVKIAVQLKY